MTRMSGRTTAANPTKAESDRTSGYATFIWRGDALEILDQRRLPAIKQYLHCESATAIAQAIRTLAVRGAPAIGCVAAYAIALHAQLSDTVDERAFRTSLLAVCDELAATRPTAVNLFWALQRMRDVIAQHSGASTALRQKLVAEACAIEAQDLAANRAMGAHGAALVPSPARIMTYCNAGALATAGHGTALGVIRSAREAGKQVSVLACETRPVLQGARLTAWELTQDGFDVTLLADNMAGSAMARGMVDLVVVGTDRVAANGDVANKIGTYPLAVLAQRHGIPFYVACPLSTIDFKTRDGGAIPIEERAPAEVTGYAGRRWAPVDIAVANPAFDVTPARLVSALITERGVIKQPSRARLRALFE